MAEEVTTTTEEAQGADAIEAAEQSAEAEVRAKQEAAEREEASKIDSFLRSRGIPGYAEDAERGDDDEGPGGLGELSSEDEDEQQETAQPTEEDLMGLELEVLTNALDQVEGKKADEEGEGRLSDAEIGFRRREESRRLQQVQSENEQLRNYMNALLSHMKQSGQQTAQPQHEGTDETPTPDLFEDPDGYVEAKLGELLAPYEEKLQKLDQVENQLRAQQVEQYVRKAETEWEQAHPGYVDRLAAYRRAFVAELQYFGMPLENAQLALFENEKGILKAALNVGANPAEILDRTAHRWIGGAPALNGNGSQSPEQQGQQQQPIAGKKPGKFDRAREAAGSAAAGSLSEGAGATDGSEITVDTLLASGASPEQVHTVLSKPGGRQDFFQLMSQLERASEAPDE